ncbi:GntR family transcriptional regulator [Clostridium sp. D5]|uniref:GntR family transcriptional regulator n=1 Tax=Clostridium sp. D5 TaxID=556261 RepID=UPI0001FC809D|nr:transcriptional regulator, GntR family [Clostridium sp. D5]
MINIDYQSRTPIYEQIVERFQMLILKGVLKPDDQMPSVRSLALQLSINPNTIQKAYAQLEQQGYISGKRKGQFCFRHWPAR